MPIKPAFGTGCRLGEFGAALVLCLSLAPLPASACTWRWSYSAAGIAATGTLTTAATPDANGYYLITGITGTRNGAPITRLQPTGKPIPGNEPFGGDNLIRLAKPQLTQHGFGFETSEGENGGDYANPFFADFLPKPAYLEFFSKPPYGKADTTELPVLFTAVRAAACSAANP